jgi:hypothetical protein
MGSCFPRQDTHSRSAREDGESCFARLLSVVLRRPRNSSSVAPPILVRPLADSERSLLEARGVLASLERIYACGASYPRPPFGGLEKILACGAISLRSKSLARPTARSGIPCLRHLLASLGKTLSLAPLVLFSAVLRRPRKTLASLVLACGAFSLRSGRPESRSRSTRH